MNDFIYVVCFSECFIGNTIDMEETKAFANIKKAQAYCDYLNKQFLTDNSLEPGDACDEWVVIPMSFEKD